MYIVIVIALVIALLCSSLIAAAYFYRLQYQRTFRYSQLQCNLGSGINILLESSADYSAGQNFSLFNQENDTIRLRKQFWGMNDIGIVKAFIQHDTLTKVFSMAHRIDSTKWAALYLIDEDRSLSVSGKTSIEGDAFIPKAGIKEAYINNQAYQGDKRLITGSKKNSTQALPSLDATRLQQFQSLWKQTGTESSLPKEDTLRQSFLLPTHVISFGKQPAVISSRYLEGNIILKSDTIITLDSTVTLKNILVLAQYIKVKSGFKGTCQLFATDSISLERNCSLAYPSCIGVLSSAKQEKAPPKISIGENSTVSGTVLIYQQQKSEQLQPLVDLGKHVTIEGQVYVPGMLNYKDGLTIHGSVMVNRFLYQTDFTRYENYLINAQLSSKQLSPYYLTSGLLPVSARPRKVLQWIE